MTGLELPKLTHADHNQIVLVHAPLHAPTATTADAKRALGLGGCIVNMTEAYALQGWLHRRAAYRCTVGRSQRDTRGVRSPRGDAGDNPVMSRREHKLITGWAVWTTAPSVPLRLAPERWLTGIELEHPALGTDLLEAWNAHPNPVGHPDEGRGVRMVTWDRTMNELEARLTRGQNAGNVLVGSGDLQVGRGVATAADLFHDLGLKTWNVGPDWIWWDPNRLRLISRKVLTGVAPSATEPRPHSWLKAVFEAVR